MSENTAVIVLAAGLGKRMKSDRAKVLHEILGVPMIHYVVDAARSLTKSNVIVVVGHQADKVKEVLADRPGLKFVTQSRQLGTGHAVGCALPELTAKVRQVIIVYGDVPLLSVDTLERLLKNHVEMARDITILAMEIPNPSGYGRIVHDQRGRITSIVEEVDATEEQRTINLINTGIYCVNADCLSTLLAKIKPQNAQGEYYLTDIVAIGGQSGQTIGMIMGHNAAEFVGVNSAQDIENVENILSTRSGKKS